jgi:hypothetical protein
MEAYHRVMEARLGGIEMKPGGIELSVKTQDITMITTDGRD